MSLVLQEELKTIKQKIASKQVSIIFDSTTHVTEAFVIILRFLDNLHITQSDQADAVGKKLDR